MNLSKHYRFTFELLGLLLFLAIMLPNFIWFAVPAPQDVLRTAKSVFPMIEKLGSIFQILFIAALCFLRHIPDVPLKKHYWQIGIIGMVLLYFVGWGCYYASIVNLIVLLDLCLAPCLALLLFAWERKNWIALPFGIAFLVCHVSSTVANFLIK